MKEITITHDGFHGRRDLVVRPIRMTTWCDINNDMHFVPVVSARVARRLNRAVCGIANCKCGERIAGPIRINPPQPEWVILAIDEMSDHWAKRGNYPQK